MDIALLINTYRIMSIKQCVFSAIHSSDLGSVNTSKYGYLYSKKFSLNNFSGNLM